MSGIVVPGWIAGGVFVAALAGLVIYLIRAWQLASLTAAKWVSLPGSTFPAMYRLDLIPVGFEESALRAALNTAYMVLVARGPWASNQLWAALSNVRVEISREEGWHSAAGQKVAGQTYTDFGIIVIGPSFAALCHELAHLAEWKIDGKINYDHTDWTARGIYAADAAYHQSLNDDPAT